MITILELTELPGQMESRESGDGQHAGPASHIYAQRVVAPGHVGVGI